jgi:hypothetical protein
MRGNPNRRPVRDPMPAAHVSGTVASDHTRRRDCMTLLWLIVWFVANSIGDHEPLLTDPVNVWTGTLILAIALDLGRHHATAGRSKRHG